MESETRNFRIFQNTDFISGLFLTAELNQLSRTQRATLYMSLLTAFNILLYRYTGQPDLLIGSPIAGRTQHETEHLIGLFVNTLVLRTQIDTTTPQSTLDLLQQTRQTALAAYAHQDIPFEQLVETLQPERSLSHSPVFQVMFVMQNNATTELNLPDLTVTPLAQDSTIAKFDLTLNAAEINGQLELTWEYATDLFEPSRIERMAAHFTNLLSAISADPTQSIHRLPLLTDAEISQLQTWNDTATDYPQNQTIVDLFEVQADLTPNNIAVSYEGETLTYRQLNAQANQLAHQLHQQTNEQGDRIIQPDSLIGICVERSLEMIIGLLGILKAGGAYVPLDPDYPTDRLAYMLADSQVPVLLTQKRLHTQLADYTGLLINLDDPTRYTNQPDQNLPCIAEPHHLAYVIYTSGSTGQPKGVCIPHQALHNFLQDMQARNKLQPTEQLLALTTLSFDIAGLELYLPLISGASLQLANQTIATDGHALQTKIAAQPIRMIQATPATWQLLKASHWQTTRPITLLCGGEALSTELGNYLLQQSAQVWNLYGPTETTIWSTAHDITAQPQHPEQIGRPIANTRLYLLDTMSQPVPIGIPGELCIAGAGLARGYLNRPELTAEKFIRIELFGKTERVYKTGDLARWLPDGNLEYLGRIDHQVKLRGFRIELGEIEAVLNQQANVSETVVVVHEREANKTLAAYITSANPTETIDQGILRAALQAKLPNYMIPNSISVLDALPLTPNGKIDRRALPEPEGVITTAVTLPPRDPLECQLIAIWQQVLANDQLGIQDDFFTVGGHSLLAMRLMSLIQQHCAVQLPVSVLFQYPTIAAIAELIRQQPTDKVPTWSHCVPLQTQGESTPLFLLPGAIGSVLYLQPLAAALGQQQPIYGMQTPGLQPGETAPDTVEALAAYHLAAIRQQQPEGPYHILGHSSGGRVAFELAYQLEQIGESVALLGILDTPAPEPQQRLKDPQDDGSDAYQLWSLLQVFSELTGHTMPYSLADLQDLADIQQAETQVLTWLQQHQIVFTETDTTDHLRRWVQTCRATTQGHTQYQTMAQLTCPIRLFRASEKTDEPDAAVDFVDDRPHWGWGTLTKDLAQTISVPGTHVTMMVRPQVQVLAAAIRTCLTVPDKP